jgi:hypothetical protein
LTMRPAELRTSAPEGMHRILLFLASTNVHDIF